MVSQWQALNQYKALHRGIMAVTRYPTAELNGRINEHEKRIGSLEKIEVRQDGRINDLREDVEEIADDFKKFENWQTMINNFTAKANVYIGINIFIFSLLGASVIALIWSLITGQASLIFK